MAPDGKIKSKDLTYEASLPPFLQRLHAQKGGGGDPDRHERQIARPKKAVTDDAEDGPTVVDESGESLSKEEIDRLTKSNETPDDAPAIVDLVKGQPIGDGEPKASGALQQEEEDVTNRKSEQKVTDGTATKKRKMGKVVGDEEDDAKSGLNGENQSSKMGETTKPAKKKTKKPIKLAFDDEDT